MKQQQKLFDFYIGFMTFRDSLKQEMKLLKHEVELLPKDRRKEALRMRKEQLEHEQVERERGFVERLNESHESAMKRLSDTHKAAKLVVLYLFLGTPIKKYFLPYESLFSASLLSCVVVLLSQWKSDEETNIEGRNY